MEKEVKAKHAKLDTRGTTYIKGTGLSGVCENSHVACVDVKDNKILRIRPLHYDWRYSPEHYKPWKIEARGKTFQPTSASALAPFGVAYKKRVQSPNRILYPLKRVDWDPDGERNPQNRGNSKYRADLLGRSAGYSRQRNQAHLGKIRPGRRLCRATATAKPRWWMALMAAHIILMDMLGGYTQQIRNPDSWEGWYWGAKHVWGMEPVGLQ